MKLRFLCASELFLGIALGYVWFKIPFVINGIGSFYVISQALRKNNRGHFYTGFITPEFWVIVLLIIYNWYFKLPWYFIVGNYGIYALARGFTHTIGVKTQTLIKM